MDTIYMTPKRNLKSKFKRCLKKILQPLLLSQKDRGKKLYYDSLKKNIKKNFIFYEAFAGLGILDHPRAIFKALLNDTYFDNYVHIWSIDNPELAILNIEEFSNRNNVLIVRRGSDDYYRYLATCQYLIANTTFGYFFSKRPEQIYINTWHGVPTKYMGYEHLLERVENARGPARHFLVADYLLSANRFMTDIMYRRAYKINGLYEGKLLEIGSPRCDFLIHPDQNYIFDRLATAGIRTDKKIILYAPTWKGTLYDALEYDTDALKSFVHNLSMSVNQDEYCVYLRIHYFLYRQLANDPDLQDILIPFTIDTNELLAVTDVLISDYSSIIFDYLLTGKPMLFYVPDLENYKNKRGLYIPIKTLPGPISSDPTEIFYALSSITRDSAVYFQEYGARHTAMHSWCTYNEDGLSCQRFIDIVFRNELSFPADEALRRDISSFTLNDYQKPALSFYCFNKFSTDKEKRLIFFDTNKSTDEDYKCLKLTLEQIDYNTTDITLLVSPVRNEKNKIFFNTLPSEVRILVRYDLPFVTRENKAFFEEEWIRLLGNVHFDKITDI